jgi:hypothetical protein
MQRQRFSEVHHRSRVIAAMLVVKTEPTKFLFHLQSPKRLSAIALDVTLDQFTCPIDKREPPIAALETEQALVHRALC